MYDYVDFFFFGIFMVYDLVNVCYILEFVGMIEIYVE